MVHITVLHIYKKLYIDNLFSVAYRQLWGGSHRQLWGGFRHTLKSIEVQIIYFDVTGILISLPYILIW
jgi:hypothetical protein